jgi:uncharacterized protein (DUF1778 family)
VAKTRKKRTTKSPDKLKGDMVRVRVTAEQKRALTEAADRAGLDVSNWLRQLALRAAGVLSDS